MAAVAAWLWWERTRERPLEPGWEASVITLAGGHALGARPVSSYAVRFADPFGVAVAPDGTIYVADGVGSHRIFRLSAGGAVAVLAGGAQGFADGAGPFAQFRTPSGLALDSTGTLYVADTGNDAIRRITPEGVVTTFSGSGAGLNGPLGIAAHPDGRLIVADTYNDRVVALDRTGAVMPIAGAGVPGFADGAADGALFDTPAGVAVGADGTIYVADTGNGAVRVISSDGLVSTLAPGFGLGSLRPVGVAVGGDGSIFVADEGGRIVEVMPDGGGRVVAGSGPGYRDGRGLEALFRAPSGVAVAAPGRLIVADRRNGLVRLVAARTELERLRPAPPLRPHFDVEAFGRAPLLWPFAPLDGPFEITGTLGEPRGGEGSERLHAGLDIHAAEGTTVRAVRGGTAAAPLAAGAFGSLNEFVRLGPIAYVHLRVGRDHRDRPFADERFVATVDERGRATSMRVKRGAVFTTGDVIGTVNRFYHSHLNVGWPGEEVNPLRFTLPGFEDTVRPTIARGGVQVLTEDGVPLTRRERRRLLVHGPVRVVVDAWDQVDGNLPRRRLGLYRLGYQLLHPNGVPLPGFEEPRETIRFDRHPGDPAAARIVYASGSGIPVYGARRTRFLYQVTSTLRDGVAADATLDTTALPPGDYTLRILAADISGNEALRNRDLAITVVSGPPE